MVSLIVCSMPNKAQKAACARLCGDLHPRLNGNRVFPFQKNEALCVCEQPTVRLDGHGNATLRIK
jgi:hypothetical protein